MLAVFLSVFMYYGLPAMAFRIGQAFGEGERFDGTTRFFGSPDEIPVRDEPVSPFARASRHVRAAVVRVQALLPLEAHGAVVAAESSKAVGPVRQSRGCGLVIDSQGYFLTSHRVVGGALQVSLFLPTEERPFPAQIVGGDAGIDLALLKFKPPAGGVAAVELSDSGRIEAGDLIMAVGHTYQPGEFLWLGVVNSSGRRASPACCDAGDCIQTTAAHPLNCGAPLVNAHGSVVGINTSFRTAQGLRVGLAVPAAIAREAAVQFLRQGGVTRGWLGLFIHPAIPSGKLQQPEGYPSGSVALGVDYVVPGSPAEQAGVRAGDIILRFGGSPIVSTAVVRKQIARTPLGADVVVTLGRGEETRNLKIVIGPQPATPPQLPGEKEWGLRLLSHLLSEPTEAQDAVGQSGVIVQEVGPRCRARGLSPRDIILSVNDAETPTLESYCREVSRLCAAQVANRVRLVVLSKGDRREIAISDE